MKVRIWTLSICVMGCAVAAARGDEQDSKSRLLEAEKRALRSQIAALKDMNAAGQKSLAALNNRAATLEKKLADAYTERKVLLDKNEKMKGELAQVKMARCQAHRALATRISVVHESAALEVQFGVEGKNGRSAHRDAAAESTTRKIGVRIALHTYGPSLCSVAVLELAPSDDQWLAERPQGPSHGGRVPPE